MESLKKQQNDGEKEIKEETEQRYETEEKDEEKEKKVKETTKMEQKELMDNRSTQEAADMVKMITKPKQLIKELFTLYDYKQKTWLNQLM